MKKLFAAVLVLSVLNGCAATMPARPPSEDRAAIEHVVTTFRSAMINKDKDSFMKNPARVEETFDNVRIDSDGDVAQVWFDYSFNEAGYKANWGKESWHMVRTGDGWKINSVIWSMEFNPVPPKRENTTR